MAQVSIVVEYMCTYCGTKQVRLKNFGRPQPGVCPRRIKGMPHRWVINRKWNKNGELC